MPKLRAHRLVVLLVALILLLPAAASAQSGQTQAHINDVIGPNQVPGPGGLPGLSLEIDFTLLDGQGQVLTSNVVSPTLQLASGGSYPVQLQKLETPWSVVVLLDASQTLGKYTASATFTGMRKAIADAVDKFPDGTNIAVEKFDSQPTTILPFTPNKDQVKQVITDKQFQASTSGAPCLYDAAYDAVSLLSRAPGGVAGRRALLIVTASASCSQRQASEVVDLAQRNHIQIYAVGLLGYTVTGQDLSPLTTATGGLVDTRELATLNFGLSNLISSLRVQWQAKAILYPPAGHETAVLKLTLPDQTQLSTQPVSFDVGKSFAQPPSLSIKGVVISLKQGVRFSLDVVSPQLINQLKLTITSQKTGQVVFEQLLPAIQVSYDQPVTNLVLGDNYDLKVTAIDSSGATLAQTGAPFQFQPPQSALKITQVTTQTVPSPRFVVQVESTNLDVTKYNAWLQTDGQTDQINLTTTTAIANPITISADNVRAGVYEVLVQARDKSDAVLSLATSPPVAYQPPVPPPPPSAYDLLLNWVRQPPVYLSISGVTCLAILLLALVVWAILPKPEPRPRAVELVVPEVRRRPPPVILDASRSQSLPPSQSDRLASVRPPPPAGREVAPPSQSVDDRRGPPPAVAAGGMPKACLSGVAPSDLRVASNISKSSFTIGRRNGNDLVLSVDNKIGVSGRHATIKYVDGRFYIVDDNSTFGTFVNDQRLPAGTPTLLEDTAMIGLGPKVKIQFRLNCP